jgi:hypothetical protein
MLGGSSAQYACQRIKIFLLLQLFIVSSHRGYIIDGLQPAGAFRQALPGIVKP